MAQITIPDNIKEGEVIDVTHINSFIEQMNAIGERDTSINGSNIRNEGIDRRNILRDQVQRTGENNTQGTWLRTGPVSSTQPPIWFETHWGLPHPSQIPQLQTLGSDSAPGFSQGGYGPGLDNIPVVVGDKLLITCSFAFSVFPLNTDKNQLINAATHGGYEVQFQLFTPYYAWPGTYRWFNTVASSNVQGGGQKHIATQNTCTIVGYKEITGGSPVASTINVYLKAKCVRSKSGARSNNVLRIKSFHMFAKIVRK